MKTTVFFLVYFIGSWADQNVPTVNLNAGPLSGKFRTSHDGRIFSAFEGIPYAKPPVEELRFKEPQPIISWTGTWVANTKHACLQLTLDQTIAGDEDCLYINVYVPREKITDIEKLDVIVHIHGGAFMMGSAHWNIGPEYLMDRDIIFVTFNYRLGALGFLSTQDDVLPGNNGLKDQALALRWIQENIKNFGGNPESVTLTGLSAGGASVHYHYLSPLSKGLFHRGFSQSGTALNPWSLQEAPLEKAKKLGVLVGCNTESSRKLVECLKQRPAQQIVEAVKQIYSGYNLPLAPFAPVIEHGNTGAFLSNHPYMLLHKGDINDVPWITSVTTEEGIFPTVFFIEKLEYLEEHWADIIPLMLEFNHTMSSNKKPEIADLIREHYFENKPLALDNIQSLIKLCSDRLFSIDAEKAIALQAHSAKSPVYFFKMGYAGQHSFTKLFTTLKNLGVSHGDDSFFYLYPQFGEFKLSETNEKMKNMFLDMLTTYAKTDKPKFGEVNWQPTKNKEEFVHLLIKGPDDIRVQYNTEYSVANEFWNKLGLLENENIVIVEDARKDEL